MDTGINRDNGYGIYRKLFSVSCKFYIIIIASTVRTVILDYYITSTYLRRDFFLVFLHLFIFTTIPISLDTTFCILYIIKVITTFIK